jgi:hypothetical protein
MNYARIERIASELSIVLFVVVVVLSWIAMADAFFDWDLLQGFFQDLAGFAIAAFGVQLAGTSLLSALLNLRRMAEALDRRGSVEAGAEPQR